MTYRSATLLSSMITIIDSEVVKFNETTAVGSS